MAVQIKIPGVTFTDADDLPVIVRADAILPEVGGLFLVDPTHLSNPWAAGVPANGSTVPNLAWEQAVAMIGSGTESSLAADIYNAGLTSTAGLVERSTKGGLHGILSPTHTFATDGAAGVNVALPAAIYDYARANDGHKFYFSLWHRVTRTSEDPSGSTKMLAYIATGTPVYMMAFSQKATFTGTLDSGSSATGVDMLTGPQFRWAAGTPGATFDSDTVSTTYTPGHRSVFLVGNRNAFNAGAQRGKAGSRILYRAYLEDLTVSGRTAAQVTEIDNTMFTAACTTSGGRYYGDTYTDPATVA